MKKISSLLLITLAGVNTIAQTVVEPPPAAPEQGGSSVWVKVLIAVVAIAVMSLIFYFGKRLNKKKSS